MVIHLVKSMADHLVEGTVVLSVFLWAEQNALMMVEMWVEMTVDKLVAKMVVERLWR